jgi:hypothetical protein
MQVHVAIFHEPIDGSPDSLAISIVKKEKKKKKNVLKASPIVPGLRV